jgi:hypothetical protein
MISKKADRTALHKRRACYNYGLLHSCFITLVSGRPDFFNRKFLQLKIGEILAFAHQPRDMILSCTFAGYNTSRGIGAKCSLRIGDL